MNRIRYLVLALCCASMCHAVTVAITHDATNPYKDASNRLVTGTLKVSWPSFNTGTGNVGAGSTTVPITNGEFTVSLVANDTSDPPTFYTAIFNTGRGGTFPQQWVVPSVAGPLEIGDVVRQSLSPVTITIPQISVVGALGGDFPYFNGSRFAPFRIGSHTTGQVLTINTAIPGKIEWKTPSGGGGGSGLWGDITGTLSDQTDLAAALALRLAKSSNLSDLTSASTARTNLGLGSAATFASTAFEVPLTFGGALLRTSNAVDVLANGITSSKMAVVNTRRTACIRAGSDSAADFLTDGELSETSLYEINSPQTLVEISVRANDGTPNVILGRERAGSTANLTSGALATAAAGGRACSKTTAVACIDGTTASATLQNTALLAGDYIGLVSGTAGGEASWMTVCFTTVVN